MNCACHYILQDSILADLPLFAHKCISAVHMGSDGICVGVAEGLEDVEVVVEEVVVTALDELKALA
jgi:hypothetical protein